MNSFRVQNPWYVDYLPVTAGGLGLARISVSLAILFFLIPGDGLPHYRFLADLPPGFYSPAPGPMQLLGQFPPFSFFLILHAVILLSAVAMLAGYRTKTSSILCGLAMLLLQGVLFSAGKIDHEIVVPLVPLVMAFSNWGAAWSVDSIRKPSAAEVQSWPLALMALLIGFMMFTAGFPKLLGGWLDPTTQAAQSHVLNQFYGRERQDLLAAFAAGFHSPLLWELLDWGTVLFELLFLVAVFRAAWFRFFLMLAVLFHTGTMLTMNIAFLPNFLAYSLFLNWSSLHGQIVKREPQDTGMAGNKTGRNRIVLYALLLVMLFVLLRWTGSQFGTGSDLQFHEVVLVTASAFYVLITSAASVTRYLINRLP
ncbi:MAG: hypothetical protein EA360_11740 [Balneolaceae bacterium]|nr:MAG: hypothetical protein EA360_11740 [Balneolaceae bacterium]